MNLSENKHLKRPNFDSNHAWEPMRNIYKLTEEVIKGDPYIGVCFQALTTLECLC